jgi:sugar lactone lactonase YvrE
VSKFFRATQAGTIIIALFAAGNASAAFMYVLNENDDSVNRYSSDGTNLGSVTAFNLQGIAADAAGNLYASSGGTSTNIRKYSPTGTSLGIFAVTSAEAAGPLEFDSQGNLYEAEWQNNVIRKYSPSGVSLGIFASGGALNSPGAMAFDAAGDMYVTNAFNTIREFSPTGADLGVFATVQSPGGLAFDAAGNLYVSNGLNSLIRKFSATGVDLGTFATTGAANNSPSGLAFDSRGDLYVAYFGTNAIHKFSPTGADLGNFAAVVSGVFPQSPDGPTVLVIVPEPASILLVVFGAITLVALARRPRGRLGRILVHDDTPHLPTPPAIPGYTDTR